MPATAATSPVRSLDADALTALWAEGRMGPADTPAYGSPAWTALHPNDPRRLSAAIVAAEMWRRFGDEPGLVQWLQDASKPRSMYAGPSAPVSMRTGRTWTLKATDGWPPVRVPGKPGSYVTISGIEPVGGAA